ncbi:MAG: hypothetical protein ACP5I4_14000 [Oceanipulchritudo sp.]
MKTLNMPLTRTILALLAMAATAAQATTLFDGATDAVYKATADNTNITLSEPTAGNWVMSGSLVDNTRAYIFGNLSAATALAAGESLTISFRINNLPNASNAPLSVVLTGARGVALTTADTDANTFAGSYAGLKSSQFMNSAINTIRFYDSSARPAGNPTADNNLLFDGKVNTALGQFNTLTGADRFDAGRTADISMTVSHNGTAWTLGYTFSMVGGSGPQSFTSLESIPANIDFMLTDAFTTFAIGFSGGLDIGSTMDISGLTVTHTTGGGGDPAVPVLVIGRSGDNLEIICASESGFSYQLQSSSDLGDSDPWGAVETKEGTGGNLTFSVPAPATGTREFYRVVVPAP